MLLKMISFSLKTGLKASESCSKVWKMRDSLLKLMTSLEMQMTHTAKWPGHPQVPLLGRPRISCTWTATFLSAVTRKMVWSSISLQSLLTLK